MIEWRRGASRVSRDCALSESFERAAHVIGISSFSTARGVLSSSMPVAYTHLELNREIESIGGRFVFDKELRLPCGGREALAVFGSAIVDTSCCGPGGCRFANVPGFIIAWKSATNPDGTMVSQVEPIEDEAARDAVVRKIHDLEPCCQVNFL